MPLPEPYIDAIKQFEGFSARPQWDYAQYSSGYGTKATAPTEQIDQATADMRLRQELGAAAAHVDKVAPNLPEGVRAALTSLTFNAGPSWSNGGLGKAIQAGDYDTAGRIFQQYNRAGGSVLPGLTSRRAAEASWFNTPPNPSPEGQPVQLMQGPQQPAMNAAALGRQSTPAGVPLFGGQQPQGGGGQMAGMPDMPQPQPMQFMQLRKPQPVDLTGLQQFLQARRGMS